MKYLQRGDELAAEERREGKSVVCACFVNLACGFLNEEELLDVRSPVWPIA